MQKFKNNYWPAIIWSAIIFILLILPGSAFPDETFLSKICFDKIVHILLFSFFVWFWCRAVHSKKKEGKGLPGVFIAISVTGLLFGYALELVQKYCVISRSYDPGDVIADATGCLLGLLVSWRAYIKK